LVQRRFRRLQIQEPPSGGFFLAGDKTQVLLGAYPFAPATQIAHDPQPLPAL